MDAKLAHEIAEQKSKKPTTLAYHAIEEAANKGLFRVTVNIHLKHIASPEAFVEFYESQGYIVDWMKNRTGECSFTIKWEQ